METVIHHSTWLPRAKNFGGTSRKARQEFGMILTEPNLAKTADPEPNRTEISIAFYSECIGNLILIDWKPAM